MHRHEGPLDEHAIAQYIIIPISLSLMLVLLIASILEKHHISWLPESVVVILLGMVLGTFLEFHLIDLAIFHDHEKFSEVCAVILNLGLLPMLIFESGWSLRHRDFGSQFVYILLFAVVGSLISFGVVGSLIFYTGSIGLHKITMARTAFAYASLISATDPVATLATYSSLRVDPLLNIMVFGDSTFNDAVAIVLFKVLNNDDIMGTRLQQDWSEARIGELVVTILGGVLKIFTGSFLIGCTLACVYLLIFRFGEMHHAPRLEILFLTISAYLTFAVAEVLHMSGIVATIFCGVILGIYARPHLSYQGSLLSNYCMKQVASMCDMCVFLLTGVCVVDLHWSDSAFALWAGLACLVGRALSVFPTGYFTNWLKAGQGFRKGTPEEHWHLLSGSQLFMMWHGGLRGAIALTLCMQLGPWVDRIDGEGTCKILHMATFLIIVVFLLVFGGSTQFCLTKLKIPMGEHTAEDKLWKTEVDGRIGRTIRWLDATVMVPLFIGKHTSADDLDVYGERKYDDVEEVIQRGASIGSPVGDSDASPFALTR